MNVQESKISVASVEQVDINQILKENPNVPWILLGSGEEDGNWILLIHKLFLSQFEDIDNIRIGGEILCPYWGNYLTSFDVCRFNNWVKIVPKVKLHGSQSVTNYRAGNIHGQCKDELLDALEKAQNFKREIVISVITPFRSEPLNIK